MNKLKTLEARMPASARLILGALCALLLSGAVAVYNVDAGPLRNLNDIGGWGNRALLIAMAAAMQVILLVLTAAMSRKCVARMLLRQVIMTAGFVILLLPINQKTYAFSEQLLPLIRAMDAGGLAAIAGMETSLSSPALTMLYLITRGPVYDMYMVKLACVAGFMLLALLAMRAADKANLGLRAEAVLSLCLILPQGFMSAACAAQFDVLSAAMLAVCFALLAGEKPCSWLAAMCYALAVALSGAALYALPVLVVAVRKKNMAAAELTAALAVVAALCLPSVLSGQSALHALLSPFKALFDAPAYASGAPNLMNLFPRAAVNEMPEYFMLSQLEPLGMVDPISQFSPYYTEANFATIMRGMALCGMACYALVFALVMRREMSLTARAFALALAAGIACPGATAGMWLLVSVIALYAAMTEPRLRASACMVLFAALCSAAYPVTGEVLLPMIASLALCLLALFDLLGMFDANRKGGQDA